MDFSVVIPAYNGAATIQGQLTALAAQTTDLEWEVVVADNNSTDGTAALVRQIAQDFPVDLRVVPADRAQGVSHARNAGALASRGEVIAFCDTDDRVAGGWVQAAWDAVRGGLDVVGGINLRLEDPWRPDTERIGGGVVHEPWGSTIQGCNFAVRSDLFFRLRGFDESLPAYGCEDIEFCVRASGAGARIGESEDMVLYFAETTGARAGLKKVASSAEAVVHVWARHPEVFPRFAGAGFRAWQLAKCPADLALNARKLDGPRHIARLSVERVVHFRTALAGRLRGWATPRLISDEDLAARG